MKTFTLEEAQSMLPLIQKLLKRALEERAKAGALQEQLQELAKQIAISGGMLLDVQKLTGRREAIQQHVHQARESLEELDAIGVQIKDIESGLLDFPCRLEGEVVLLCWRMGEDSITHWHTVEAGFRGRRPIDDRFRRKGSTRPN